MVEGVLEQARRADGERRVDPRDQGAEIADVLGRQLGLLEGVGDSVIGEVGVGDLGQVVALHEVVEDVGGEDHRLRNRHLDVGKFFADRAWRAPRPGSGEDRRLAAELAVADSGER